MATHDDVAERSFSGAGGQLPGFPGLCRLHHASQLDIKFSEVAVTYINIIGEGVMDGIFLMKWPPTPPHPPRCGERRRTAVPTEV